MLEVNRMKTRSIRLAMILAGVGLLGLVPATQAEVRVGPNYRMDSDPLPFRGKDQPSMAVNPANPQHVVMVNADYLGVTCEGTVSRDGGATWSRATPLLPPDPVGAQAPFDNRCLSFQTIEFGSGDNVYATAGLQRTAPSIADFATLVYRSVNGGATWQRGVIAMQEGPGRESAAAGSPPQVGPDYFRPSLSVQRGAGAGGADRVYVTANEGVGSDAAVAVSNNGAQSFSAVVNANPADVTITDSPSKPVINADGSVTIVWRTRGVQGLLQAARSTDQGQTWSPPVNVAAVSNNGTSTQTHVESAIANDESSSASYPRLIGDPSRSGRLYLVYNQGGGGPTAPAGGFQGADHFISPDSAVFFQRSSDNGATWSTPKLINDRTQYPGSTTVQTRHPTVSVSPGGRVNIAWHDRRHWYQGPGERNCTHSHIFCEDVRLGDTYYSSSTDGGATFSPGLRINDRSLNLGVGYDTRPSAYWNYGPQTVTVGGDQVLVAWMDSRAGNWDTDTEDIFLAKVDFNASGPAPQTNIDEADAISRSVALSKLGYQGGNEGALVGVASRNASAVVIVNQDDVAGAMAGTVLGRANPAPVLLSAPGGLSDAVKAEIARIKPGSAFVIGDTGRLSAQVVADLAAAGVASSQIVRLSGGSDAATAALMADQFDRRRPAERDADGPAFDAAIIANPASPDAAAAVGLAAARRLPILYVGPNSVPSETQAALSSLDIDQTLVIGGTQAVSDSVLGQLPSARRLGGADQYATSRAVVAESRARGLPGNIVYVADGSKPMDAALLGGVVARATGLLVLAPIPLYTTATMQASDFGLGGISQFFLLGPPVPGPAGVQPPTNPGQTTPPAARVLPNMVRPGGSARQSGRRIVTSVRGRMIGTRGRACGGRVKIGVRFAGNRRVTRTARMRSNCRYAARISFPVRRLPRSLRPRRKTLILRIAARFQGNAGLRTDLSPTKRMKVRRTTVRRKRARRPARR